MFNLPDYPDVYNTRHITCVCCKEKFAVTEGHQGKNPDHNRWRVLPNEAQKIRLRHEPNREQRSILPTTREMPLPQENVPLYFQQPPVAFSPAALNCPRCGADNANWISLNQTGNRSILQVWRLRFPDVFVARALALAFMAFALVLFFVMKIHIGKAIILFFFIPAAIVGVIWELTREWNHLRENKHIKRVVPKTKDKERELWIRGGALVFLFTLVFPVIFFSLAPTAFNIFLEFC